VDFTYPTEIRFACSRCGLCCGDTKQRTRHILVLKNEAEKIASHTGQLVTDFAIEIAGNDPYIYEMKKTNEGKCFFLKDNQCSIYRLRPLICICYPFELKFNEEAGLHNFVYTLECPRINKGRFLKKTDFKRLLDTAQERLS